MKLLLYVFDIEQSHIMLNEYKKYPKKFDYINIFSKNNDLKNSADGLMCRSDECNYRINHLYPGKGNDLTDFVLNKRLAGNFIVLLEDTSGGNHHAVGINIAERYLFDPMESKVMMLNNETL